MPNLSFKNTMNTLGDYSTLIPDALQRGVLQGVTFPADLLSFVKEGAESGLDTISNNIFDVRDVIPTSGTFRGVGSLLDLIGGVSNLETGSLSGALDKNLNISDTFGFRKPETKGERIFSEALSGLGGGIGGLGFRAGRKAFQDYPLGYTFSSSVPAAAKSKDKSYSQPFTPFTGYTSKVKPNDNIAQSEAGDQNKLSSPTNRQVDAETAKKIEEAPGQVTKSASSIVGMTITAGDANGARAAVNKINGEVSNAVKNFKAATPMMKNKILSDASKSIASLSTGMSAGMISSTFSEMAPKMNQGLHKLYKDKYGEVLKKTGNIALAKKAASLAQKAKLPSILNIENAIPCMMKNVTDKLEGNISNLLAPLLDNVQNFNDFIGDQFNAGILNSII